ncbi:polyhydroxyalkanoate synthesis repressor PhaR [Dichotomicrobium thermohalophilum]|uniref:Polyhydroxyalkanoate synthesis repressor PhaR n=1 Tax=Dichotomicrobium thermohalophilum TaxID=933063 RepID=A0A397Q7A3_9HYPH|nr:polyhydroxyalkanoate synthesis repressor PhaR [Dichotomicrobium thermohalophilum]RIA55685.1 polyhydroxyalkanoate synthesis repressor PhaR [Dichotomicrobium thermohalophilum]
MPDDTSRPSTKVDKEPAVIKKYANRRLYNTDTSTYVTLDNLAEMVRSERDFVVYDAKTGEDLTHQVLTQIIVEQESKGQNLLPISFLRQLIRFYGNSMEKLVPSYLEFSMNTLTREQEKYTQQLAETFGNAPFGNAAFEAIQKQALQNMEMFEHALNMFKPFGAGEGEQTGQGAAEAGDHSPGDSAPASAEEVAQLRAQLAEMRARLDKLTNDGGGSDA